MQPVGCVAMTLRTTAAGSSSVPCTLTDSTSAVSRA
jgi:hypothetical protein